MSTHTHTHTHTHEIIHLHNTHARTHTHCPRSSVSLECLSLLLSLYRCLLSATLAGKREIKDHRGTSSESVSLRFPRSLLRAALRREGEGDLLLKLRDMVQVGIYIPLSARTRKTIQCVYIHTYICMYSRATLYECTMCVFHASIIDTYFVGECCTHYRMYVHRRCIRKTVICWKSF